MKTDFVYPERFSDMILLALEDLEKCEKNPLYIIDMTNWYRHEGETCKVCLAGSVMAQSFGLNQTEEGRNRRIPPSKFGTIADMKLTALENVRVGDVQSALLNYYHFEPDKREKIDRYVDEYGVREVIHEYEESEDLFREKLREISEQLREFGL